MGFVQFDHTVRLPAAASLTAEASAHLVVDSLTVRHGSHVAVDHLSFTAAKGELLTLLGPSGCGKTSILRSIAGFAQPSGGRILVGGRDIATLASHRRNIGMVFQSYALFPHLTVLENVAFGLRMRGVRRAERETQALAALDLVGLAALAPHYPAQLSGGQQQRVALARAIAIKPEILLLDEPLSNLDAALRAELRQEIRSLQTQLAITTILVTHDQQEALAVSDRIAILNHGRLVEIGSPESLCERPSHGFAAAFIAARTVISGTTNNGIFQAPGLTCSGAAESASAIVLRGARLRFGGDGPLRISGHVAARVYLGDFYESEIECAAGRIKILTPSESPPPAKGSECLVCAFPGGYSFICRA